MNNNRGFLMAEAVLATLIVSFVLVSLLSTIGWALKLNFRLTNTLKLIEQQKIARTCAAGEACEGTPIGCYVDLPNNKSQQFCSGLCVLTAPNVWELDGNLCTYVVLR